MTGPFVPPWKCYIVPLNLQRQSLFAKFPDSQISEGAYEPRSEFVSVLSKEISFEDL